MLKARGRSSIGQGTTSIDLSSPSRKPWLHDRLVLESLSMDAHYALSERTELYSQYN